MTPGPISTQDFVGGLTNRPCMWYTESMGMSSNGRTPALQAGYRGSNPLVSMGPWARGRGRHPVTVESAGSNPVGPAKTMARAPKAARGPEVKAGDKASGYTRGARVVMGQSAELQSVVRFHPSSPAGNGSDGTTRGLGPRRPGSIPGFPTTGPSSIGRIPDCDSGEGRSSRPGPSGSVA